MSLAHTAEYLKQYGRGPDDQLVHMSSNELRGLQKLAKSAGGSLTINPHTGLPEAGFLDSMLPMVLGAGLAMTGIGAPAAALMVGAGYGIAKHDLNAGLMAGLGAYGGAGLGAGLTAAGAGAAADAGTDAIGQIAQQSAEQGAQAGQVSAAQLVEEGLPPDEAIKEAARQNAQQGIQQGTQENISRIVQNQPSRLELAGKGLTELGNKTGLETAYKALPQGTLPAAGFTVANALTPQQGVPNQLETPNNNPMNFARLSPNFKGYEPERPNPYYKAQYTDYTQNPYAPKAMAIGGLAGQTYPMSQQEHTNFMNPTQLPSNAMDVRNFEPATNPFTGDQTQAMASGGVIEQLLGLGQSHPLYDSAKDEFKRETDTVDRLRDNDFINPFHLASGGHLSASAGIPDTGIYYDTNLTTKNLPAWNAAQAGYKQTAKRANVKSAGLPKTAIEKLGGDFSDTGASGGIATLGSYSDGGRLLKGPGDGMSDNIPAQIGKHQPARLADGEFVVPADVVSHLGNGSTDAGAKKLYSMMDKIRKARTGRKAQGKQINANKFLPT